MADESLISQYNYDSFVPSQFARWLNFDESPPLGMPAPDFPLWTLDSRKTSLEEVWSKFTLTVVEFGSYT